MTFSNLGLSPATCEAVKAKGYIKATAIQAEAIPGILNGRDLVASAQTGTGKTAAFVLPLIDKLKVLTPIGHNHTRALILTPTRELALQVAESIRAYDPARSIKSAVAYGGVKINPQMMQLRGGVDILVATPGRLLDLYRQNAIRFNKVQTLVLDEADRMLDMGFFGEINEIIGLLPKKRQNLLFSATMSPEVRSFSKQFVQNPIELSINPKVTTAVSVEQILHPVDEKQKPNLLTKLIKDKEWQRVLVFTKTKKSADKLSNFLRNQNILVAAFHGDRPQAQRQKNLDRFKKGEIHVLVATDVAARGIDIDDLPQVVNFELPNIATDYVHRIGRSGRAGAKGHAISLVSKEEARQLAAIERLTKKCIQREILAEFVPDVMVPVTLMGAEKKIKRPKKAIRLAKPSATKAGGKKKAEKYYDRIYKKSSKRTFSSKKTGKK